MHFSFQSTNLGRKQSLYTIHFLKGWLRDFWNRFDHVHTTFPEHSTLPRSVSGIQRNSEHLIFDSKTKNALGMDNNHMHSHIWLYEVLWAFTLQLESREVNLKLIKFGEDLYSILFLRSYEPKPIFNTEEIRKRNSSTFIPSSHASNSLWIAKASFDPGETHMMLKTWWYTKIGYAVQNKKESGWIR